MVPPCARTARIAALAVVLGAAALPAAPSSAADDYPPADLGALAPSPAVGRTLRLLATSTAKDPHVVRVLFYGQSITEQAWWKTVADALRARYPHADLVIENRALGGFASQYLVKSAETDLYPFYPDLLVFHVLGAHDKYEDIIRRVRERTTAEILIQTDHVLTADDLDETTDPAELEPRAEEWSAFMNGKWLPHLAQKYGAALCDQRTIWKRYLRAHALPPGTLLSDGTHLNAHGEWLMAECVKACLGLGARTSAAAPPPAPAPAPAPADAWVKTFVVGKDKDVAVRKDKLRVAFDGNRIDAILRPGAGTAAVRIDGRRPSEWPELYGLSRSQATPGGKWPPVVEIGSRTPLLLEDWTLDVTRDADHPDVYDFALAGSRTGPDGRGRSDQPFSSKSGRVLIDPEGWQVDYALELAKVSPVPSHFTVRWSVEPRFVDTLTPPPAGSPPRARAITLALGLTNGPHTLELEGAAVRVVEAVRAYHPPLPLPLPLSRLPDSR